MHWQVTLYWSDIMSHLSYTNYTQKSSISIIVYHLKITSCHENWRLFCLFNLFNRIDVSSPYRMVLWYALKVGNEKHKLGRIALTKLSAFFECFRIKCKTMKYLQKGRNKIGLSPFKLYGKSWGYSKPKHLAAKDIRKWLGANYRENTRGAECNEPIYCLIITYASRKWYDN